MAESFLDPYVAAWNDHDADGVGVFMAEDVEFEDVALGEVLRGRAAVEEFVIRSSAMLSSDAVFTLVSEFRTDTRLTAEWAVSGTHDGSTPALPATNRPFTIRGATVAHLADGKFTSYRDYYDMAGFLREIGILPTG